MLSVADAAADIVTIRQLEPARGTQSPPYFNKAYQSIYKYTSQPDVYGGICGDMQYMGNHAFGAYDILSRNVAMFQNVDYKAGYTNNHASNEVFVDGKWMAVDLTFGFYFDGRLSWEEARERYLSGQTVGIIKIDGGRQTFESYSVPLKDLVKFMVIETCPGEDDYCLYSPSGDWDGTIQLSESAPLSNWAKDMVKYHTMLRDSWDDPIQQTLH